MATKSFLTREQLKEAALQLRPPSRAPDGDERRGTGLNSREFSAWLSNKLQQRFQSHADWLASDPVLLGSWARGELSPKSDIDLLFCGPEENVRRFVADISREGVKLRYRMPEDPQDWTKGVEPFDVLALFSAVPITDGARAKLELQLERLKNRSAAFRRELLKAMRLERKQRAERYDSISNFLEPNLKYGPGGLRDLEQALVARQLFPDRFAEMDHAFIVLIYYKSFFLFVREKLHLSEGANDVLTAPEQKPIADWLGYNNGGGEDGKGFMREIQKGLSRVSFYADWAIEQASSPRSRIDRVQSTNLKSEASLFKALEIDSSILMQNHVRLAADRIFAGRAKNLIKRRDQLIGQRLTTILDPTESNDAAMVALFRSRLIDHCVPDFKKVVGYVQHDQYHRFSVDAHLLQVLRELKRLFARPAKAGRLAKQVRSLTKEEWRILAFGCLYHDLAKGRGGDHAHKGVQLAQKDLVRFGKSKKFIAEVCWIVEEHLALSVAAFRENPHAPATWRGLAEKGVRGRRITLLAVFTIVDILGTNPDAWTSWKERLLAELVLQLESPETNSILGFAKLLKSRDLKGWERYLEALDPFLIGSVPAHVLSDDLEMLGRSASQSAAPKAVAVRGGRQTWVRFHNVADKPGLLLGYVQLLASSGLAVRHASIHTDPFLGVYDWFEVKTTKSITQIQRLLESASSLNSQKNYFVRFDSIEIVSADEHEWVVSFRGRDQAGALTEAARSLFQAGAQIRWAKVHTWGRQIDDVFGILPLKQLGEGEALIARLNKELLLIK